MTDPTTRAEEGATFPSEADFLRETIKVVEWQRDEARRQRNAAEASASALRYRVAVLESALKPFAAWVEDLERDFGDSNDSVIAFGTSGVSVSFGALRAACASLNGEAPMLEAADACETQRLSLADELEAFCKLNPGNGSLKPIVRRDELRVIIGALRSPAAERITALESALQSILKPFPAVTGSAEDMLEDWMSAVSRFRATARAALKESNHV